MPARITIERLLRDEDDASGQSVRNWKIEVDACTITIRLKHGDGFLLLRTDDVPLFSADLERACVASRSLEEEEKQ